MCGRYAASASQAELVETFEVDVVEEAPSPRPWQVPRWNVAPTDEVAVVLERTDKQTEEVTRQLRGLRWGLVPSWTKELRSGAPLINARLETVASKPSFKRPFALRRCLVPGDGYYEWYPLTQPDGTPVLGPRNRPRKQPFYLHPRRGPMVMAGLYEFWRNPDLPKDDPDAWVVSCAIITTESTDDLGHIHDRMPVQVPPGNWDAWLDPTLTDPDAALGLVHVPEPGEMTAHAVSTRVNTVGNEGPDLVEPLPLEDAPLEEQA